MKVDKSGTKFIIKHESIRYEVYDDHNGKPISRWRDVIGYPTIGVGHRIYEKEKPNFEKFLKGKGKMSQSQALKLFQHDLKRYSDPVNKKLQKPVTQSMFNALVSLAYNAGPNSKSLKTAINHINNGDYREAGEAIKNGPTKSGGKVRKGLVKRRNEEYELFKKEGYSPRFKKFIKYTSRLALFGGTIYAYFAVKDAFRGE